MIFLHIHLAGHSFYKVILRKFLQVITIMLPCASTTFGDAASESNQSYAIYLDADQTNNALSGQAIELGIRAAFSEVNWKLGGKDVHLVVKDHHGNTARSLYHVEQILNDDRALVLFGGMHSPPLLASRDILNQNGLLTLVPWAAATPITRGDKRNNWIFRLSLDDSKAGAVIVNDLVKKSSLKMPFLLLEDTGWGRANELTMGRRLAELDVEPVGTQFFQWGISLSDAKQIIQKANLQGADSFLLVANAPEGATFAKAILSLPPEQRKPVRSHWGITGGNFPNMIGAEQLVDLDLRFIQSAFSLMDTPLSPLAHKALASAKTVLKEEALEASQIRAPAGFIHAYDLTRLLIIAANSTKLSGNTKADRLALRSALEKLNIEIPGLVKNYYRPFTNPFSEDNFNAHEALDEKDFAMAKFDKMGNIRLVSEN